MATAASQMKLRTFKSLDSFHILLFFIRVTRISRYL